MNASELLNTAEKAGINMAHDDAYHDCVDVWFEYIMQTPEELEEYFIDALLEIFEERHERKKERMFKYMGDASESLEALGRKGYSESMTAGDATSFAFRASDMGETVILLVREFVLKMVTDNAEQYWEDCRSYHHDMMEGGREDAEYERRKEDML